MTEVIKTERLVLRRFRREDSSRLVTDLLLNEMDVVRWLGPWYRILMTPRIRPSSSTPCPTTKMPLR